LLNLPPADPSPQERDALRLAAIVNSSDDAIISKDLNGIIKTWNRAAERMFGWSSEEAVGKSIRMVIPADRQAEEDEVLGRIRQGLPVEHFETIRQRKDGSQFPISLTVSPIKDATGRLIGASKIARDITERREAEAQAERVNRQALFLAKISEALNRSLDSDETLKTLASIAVPRIADWCAVDVLGDDGQLLRLATAHVDPAKVALANEVRVRYGGDPASPYSPESVLRTGLSALLPLITDDLLKASSNGDEQRLTMMREMGLVSYLCVPMFARTRPIGTITLATAESGRRYTTADVLFAEDVSSRAALAVENSRAYEQIQVANRLKDEFLATLSHELRTPLNAVLGYARMLRSGVVTQEKIPHALDVMERNATSLTQIVEDVLDVSRIISGKVRLQVQPVTLAKVAGDAVATVQPAADAKGVRIQCLFDSKAAPVSGDPERLQQVIWNLVSNAVKFTPRNGRVQVQVIPVNSHVEVVVSDTGIGMPQAFLPHVFERFRQAEGGTTRRHGGLGLGLAIARHIVEMHGGTIHAASEGEGKGSTFRVKLPVLIAHAELHPEALREHPRAAQGAPTLVLPNLSNLQVLVVDDDIDALAMLREILETSRATVHTASSAEEALVIMERHHPDVMISDLGMPVMDGFDLIQRVRESSNAAIANMPAAALTAYARSEDRAKALRAGFDMHLAKPVDPGELVAAVAALARNRSQPIR
jgi:PAS domain S-box-containing protein